MVAQVINLVFTVNLQLVANNLQTIYNVVYKLFTNSY